MQTNDLKRDPEQNESNQPRVGVSMGELGVAACLTQLLTAIYLQEKTVSFHLCSTNGRQSTNRYAFEKHTSLSFSS